LEQCSKGKQELVRSILKPSLGSDESKELNEKLSSLVDYNNIPKLRVCELSILMLALKTCNHQELKMLVQRVLEMYLFAASEALAGQRMMMSAQQSYEKISSLALLSGGTLKQPVAESLLIAIWHEVVVTWRLEKDKHKRNKLKMRGLAVLLTMADHIQTLGATAYLLEMVVEIGFDRQIMSKFRLTKIIQMLEEKLRRKLIEDPKLTKNVVAVVPPIHSSPSQRTFLNVFKCLEICQTDTTEIEKFYLDLVCAPDFYPPHTPIAAIMSQSIDYYRSVSLYLNHNNQNPLHTKIKDLFCT
jgi:hypothetical protein